MPLINPSEECRERVYRELGTTKERLREDAEIVRKWLEQQPHLPNVDDAEMLQTMLLRNNCSVERAKQSWDLLYTLKAACPEFFDDRDPLLPVIKKQFEILQSATLDRTTKDGYRIFIRKPTAAGQSPDVSQESRIKLMTMISDLMLLEDRCFGIIIIFDLQNTNLGLSFASGHFMPIKNVDHIKKAYRVPVKGIHLVNPPGNMATYLPMLKMVLRTKMMSRLHVHSTMESLHEHVDKTLLPKEYGGEEKSLAELNDELFQRIIGHRDWFLDQDKVGKADESKRPAQSLYTADLFGSEGAFKQLNID